MNFVFNKEIYNIYNTFYLNNKSLSIYKNQKTETNILICYHLYLVICLYITYIYK